MKRGDAHEKGTAKKGDGEKPGILKDQASRRGWRKPEKASKKLTGEG